MLLHNITILSLLELTPTIAIYRGQGVSDTLPGSMLAAKGCVVIEFADLPELVRYQESINA